MAMISSPVELGFLEDHDDKSNYPFPSHVGGKPHWINPQHLPSPDILSCRECKHPMVLLLQLFVPLRNAESPARAYHRMVYVFTCTKADCHRPGACNPGMVVLRTQLPRENPYYPFNVDTDVEETPPPNPIAISKSDMEPKQNPSISLADVKPSSSHTCVFDLSAFASRLPLLCVVCGCFGDKKCGRCHSRNYCSKSHQIHDWKRGHQVECCSDKYKSAKEDKNSLTVLLPQLDIVTEPEPSGEDGKGDRKTEEMRMKEYLDFVQSDSYKKQSVEGGKELSVNDTLKEVDRDVKDKNYQKFRKRIQEEPEQVLRLQRGGEPLWVVSSCVPDEKTIPECSCGSRRIFEFQILPQMLYYLEVEKLGKERALDWGTLAVYTCERSCQQNGRQYMEEFIWKQDFN